MDKFKLASPLKYFSITQKFGENASPIYSQLGLKGHPAIDLHAPHGTPIYASHDGRVTFAGYDSHGGLGVRIRTEEAYLHNGQEVYPETIYWHMATGSLKVTGSQSVKAGDLIGLADNTGLSTGSHLHFGLRLLKREANKYDFNAIDVNNGYDGFLDPMPFLPKQNEFQTTLRLGDTGYEVEKLQAFLVRKGFLVMPPNTQFGYFGKLTQKAVYDFQLKYCNLNYYEKNILKGRIVGSKTLEALNQVYNAIV